MLRTMCEDISFVLVKNRIISEEDRDNYIYGLELLLNNILITATIVILGILFNKLFITVSFIVAFCSLRAYSGGYHADKYWKCYFTSCLTYLCVAELVTRVGYKSSHLLSIVLLMAGYSIVFFIAPLNSEKNPKTAEEMKKNNIIIKSLTSLYTLIAAIGTFAFPSVNVLWFTIIFTQLAVAVFLMAAILQRRYLR